MDLNHVAYIFEIKRMALTLYHCSKERPRITQLLIKIQYII